MIVINTRPKDLSKKINELCSIEKIELQNTHLSKIIPIKIDTDNGANKKIFENFNTYTNFIFTSRAAVENGTEFIKIKSALLNKNHKFFAVGDSTKEALAMKGFEAIMPIIKSSDGLVEMIEKSFPGQNLIICGENTNMNLQNKLAESADEIRCYNLNYSKEFIHDISPSEAIILIYNYLTFEFIHKNLDVHLLRNKIFIVASERIKSKIFNLVPKYDLKILVSKSSLDEDMLETVKKII
jgi:hypothetical protein